MGHRISYCSSCGIQLREADFEKGKACRIGERSFCSPCAGASPSTLPPEERRDLPRSVVRHGGTGQGRGPSVSDTPSRGMRHVAPTKRRTLLWPLLAAAALVGISLLALAGRPSPHPEGPGPAAPAVLVPPQKPVAPGEDPRETRAREVLGKAKELARLKPEDLPGQVAAWEEAVRACAGTPYSDIARKELEDALRRRESKKEEAELAALDAELQAARDREELARAAGLLEEARKRRAGADWAGLIDQRLRDLDAVAKARYLSLQQAALEARLRGDEPEVKKLRERAVKWGITGMIADLEAALAATRPRAAPRSPDAAALDVAWERALASARARDYPAAIRELESVRDSVRDASVKADAARDAEVLKSVAALHAEAVVLLSKSPKGGTLSLKVRDGSGGWSPVEGGLLRASAHRMDLRQGDGTAIILAGELAADSLVEIAKKAPVDARTAVAFCLLDGDVESARRRGSQATGAVPERFWSAAAKIGEAAALAMEKEARAAFHAALRHYRDPLSRTACAEKCGALLRDFADTAFVRRNRAAVAEGCGAGKDYFFAAGDLAASGAFKTSTHPKAGACWTSMEDGARDQAKENYVELAFSALPETEYRCWVWVGACCAETFAFHCQATELLVPDPKDPNRRHPAGPGEAVAAPVRHGIRYLRNSHSGHGGPKEPKRWEWVAIGLPQYSSGGPKKVRLVSDQKGFSVAAAVVSATRAGPPLEAEAKEEQELAAARGPVPGTAAPKDAFVDLFNGKDLAGWRTRFGTWRVEEGALVTDMPGDGGRFLIDTTESYGDYEVTYKLSVTRQAYMEPRFHGGARLGGFMVSAGEWHDFRGVASGGKIEAFLDGKKVREIEVQETAGPIGFFTVGGDKLRVKEVRLRKLK